MAKSPEDIESSQSRQERKSDGWTSFNTLLGELEITLAQANMLRVAEGYRDRRIADLMERQHLPRETAERFTKNDYIHIEQRGRTCFIEFSGLARAHLEMDLDSLQKKYQVDLMTREPEKQLRRRGYKPSSAFVREPEWIEPLAALLRERKTAKLQNQKLTKEEIAVKVENYIYRYPTIVMDEAGKLDLKLRYWYSREAYDDFLTLRKQVERGGWPKLLGLEGGPETHVEAYHKEKTRHDNRESRQRLF